MALVAYRMQLHELLGICGRPSYVKVASEQPHRDQYGTESREEVYLGFCSALQHGQSTQKYAQLARFWQIEHDIKVAESNWAERPVAQAPSRDHYALQASRDGQEISRYPAWDAPSTVKAASAFYQERQSLPRDWRVSCSLNLLAKVASYGALLPAYVDRYLYQAAGLGEPTRESLESAVYERSHLHGGSKEFIKVAEALVEIAQDPELMGDAEIVKVALDALENTDGLLSYNERTSLGLPEETLVDLDTDLLKVAQDEYADHVTLMNGKTIKVSGLSREVLDSVSPELAAMSPSDLRDVLPTLPSDDADLLVRLNG